MSINYLYISNWRDHFRYQADELRPALLSHLVDGGRVTQELLNLLGEQLGVVSDLHQLHAHDNNSGGSTSTVQAVADNEQEQ